MSKSKEQHEWSGYRISKEENTYLTDLQWELFTKKCVPITIISGCCSMSVIYAVGKFRQNVKIMKNSKFFGLIGAVTGLGWSLYDAKYIQNAKILEEKPNSRLSFVVRQDLSQRFRYILNEQECFELNEDIRREFHREDTPIGLSYAILVILVARFNGFMALLVAGE